MRIKSKSTDQVKVRLPKKLYQRFIEKLGETSKSEWLFNKMREFVYEQTNSIY